jgi:hypothetical protein
MILGRNEDKNSASQKAGRLAGKVAQCPQYPGKLTWWTDEETAALITRHNGVVDGAGEKRGCSVLQAVNRAEADAPVVEVPTTAKYGISETFNTCEDAKTWCGANLTYSSSEYKRHNDTCANKTCGGCGDTHIKYRGNLTPLFTEAQVRSQYANTDRSREGVIKGARIMPISTDALQWGVGTSARIMPISADALKWVVFYRTDKLRTAGEAAAPAEPAAATRGGWSEETKRKAAETRARNKAAKTAAGK